MNASSFLYPLRAKDMLPPNRSIAALGLLHAVGLVGFVVYAPAFRRLVPLHLLVSAALWALNQRAWRPGLVVWLCGVGLAGYAAEVIGVATGLPFGQYAYGRTLGPSVLDVPVVMAVNWSLLAAVVAELAALFGQARGHGSLARAAIGAALLVLLDAVMEPFAMTHDLWNWADGSVPWLNYVGWAMVAFVLLLPFHMFKLRSDNPASVWVYLLQLALFVGLLPWTTSR